MISYEETKLHLILEHKERDTLRIILEAFIKGNKDRNIPFIIKYAQKIVNVVKESVEAAE